MQLPHVGVEVLIGLTSFAIETDDVFKCGETAIVHEGRGKGDFPQARRLERSAIFLLLSNGEAAWIGGPADARVVKSLVGQIRPDMTRCAACLPAE
jgi:hypothetical protein